MTHVKYRRTAASLIPLALVSASLLTGCGYLPGAGDEQRTVTVWLMKDSASDAFLKRFTKSFEDKNPGLRLDIRIQEWTGIGEKVSAALTQDKGATASGDAADGPAPDVIEVGNTQVPQYVDEGGLLDLSLESARDFGMEEWLPGLADPGMFHSRQYGIPWYAANRVVIYNKDLFAKAGIKQPPRTRAEWLDDTRRLNTHGDQGIYLAGQDWYTLSGFIWDEGGDLATEHGGIWEGSLHTPAALRGMEFYRQLQALGHGPKDADEEHPRSRASSRRATSARSSPCPASPRLSSSRTPNSRESWATSRSPARRRPSRDPSSPAAPTWSCPRTPTTATEPSRSSRPCPARSGRRTWPGP